MKNLSSLRKQGSSLWLLAIFAFSTLSYSSFASASGEFYFAPQNTESSEEVKHNAIFPSDFYKGGIKNLVVYSNNKRGNVLLNLLFNFKSSNITVRNSGTYQEDPEEKPTRILTYSTKENVVSKTDPLFNIEASMSVIPTHTIENDRRIAVTNYYISARIYQDTELYGKFFDSLTVKER